MPATVEFRAQGGENAFAQHRTVDRSIFWQGQLDKAKPPQLDPTVVLDTRKAKEMLAKAAAAASIPGAVGLQTLGIAGKPANAGIAVRQRIGTLTVIDGKTNQQHYVLSSKLSVIGKSEMATFS